MQIKNRYNSSAGKGRVIAKLTNPYQDRVETAKSLFGILPKEADVDEAKRERLGAK